MDNLVFLHNPRCSTSRAALEVAAAASDVLQVRNFVGKPLTEDELRDLVGMLSDPVSDLVRRDAHFVELGIDHEDLSDPEFVIALLLKHPKLLQRPILVRDGKAVIGRPRERVAAFARA